MRNVIILEPRSGLANRMRVIASGLWLGSVSPLEIKMVWNLDSGLNCPFEELFEPMEKIKIIKKKFIFHFFRSHVQKTRHKKIVINLFNSLVASNYFILEDPTIKKIRAGEIDILALTKINKSLYFRTCEEFGSNSNEFTQFTPQLELQQRIVEKCKRFNDKTIGVHIRRTDNKIAIMKSPTELFIQRMKNDLQQDPDINYFLTTDDAQTEAKLKTLFGEKILSLEKDYSRNSRNGIRDAVVDLYCLANTTRIYGSWWSSFSNIASQINGAKIEHIKIE